MSRAAVRTADILGLPNKALGRILGLSEVSVSWLKSGRFYLSPGSKSFELAQIFGAAVPQPRRNDRQRC